MHCQRVLSSDHDDAGDKERVSIKDQTRDATVHRQKEYIYIYRWYDALINGVRSH